MIECKNILLKLISLIDLSCLDICKIFLLKSESTQFCSFIFGRWNLFSALYLFTFSTVHILTFYFTKTYIRITFLSNLTLPSDLSPSVQEIKSPHGSADYSGFRVSKYYLKYCCVDSQFWQVSIT
jgi:hypothetical protein